MALGAGVHGALAPNLICPGINLTGKGGKLFELLREACLPIIWSGWRGSNPHVLFGSRPNGLPNGPHPDSGEGPDPTLVEYWVAVEFGKQ